MLLIQKKSDTFIGLIFFSLSTTTGISSFLSPKTFETPYQTKKNPLEPNTAPGRILELLSEVLSARVSTEFRRYGIPPEFSNTSDGIGIKYCEVFEIPKRDVRQNSAVFHARNSEFPHLFRMVPVSMIQFLFNFGVLQNNFLE
jgi:hypothetical protein